jgi:rhodanese-related sulfurtransferase
MAGRSSGGMMNSIRELEPGELKAMLDRGEELVVLDVREHWEVEAAPFQGAVHIPMGELCSRLHELDQERPTVVLCHRGWRSAQAAAYLAQAGFAQVLNLCGGLEAWRLAPAA